MEFRLRPQGFMEFFGKQQSSGSQQNEMNQKSKKYSQKTVGILLESLRVIVSMCECVRVGYSCTLLCVCVGDI